MEDIPFVKGAVDCPILPKWLTEGGLAACPLCLGGSRSNTITGLQRPTEARDSDSLGPGGKARSPSLLTFIRASYMAGPWPTPLCSTESPGSPSL